MSESIKNDAPSCSGYKLYFALNIGKCHLKKNYDEKVILTFHFLKIFFYLNRVIFM